MDNDREIIELLMKMISLRNGVPKFLWGPMLGFSQNGKHSVLIRKFFSEALENIIKKKEVAGLGKSELEGSMDVLDRLMRSPEKFNEEELNSEIIGLFMAGHETTSNSITSCILEIARNPNIAKKIFAEIQVILGTAIDTADLEVGNESLHHFKYLDKVIRESLRLHSVVPFITARIAQESVEVLGYTFPKGTPFMVSPTHVHLDAKNWKDPLCFDPDRWDNEDISSTLFIPFGSGPHNCPGTILGNSGQKMAIIEMKVILIHLIRKYELELVVNQDLTFVYTVTYGLKNGLKMLITPRCK